MLLFFSCFVVVLTTLSCGQPVPVPDISPCDEAFTYNRTVDTASATRPYMKTCGLSLETSNLLNDAYAKSPNINQSYIDNLYDELEIGDRILTDNHIPYTMIGGTLLGAIRNGGLIPNDDDADIAIDIKYESKLKGLGNEFSKLGYTLVEFPLFGYKVKKKNYPNSTGLDIFLLKVRNINGKDVFAYAQEDAYKIWPKELFSIAGMNNLSRIPFGHLQLLAMPLADCMETFDGSWGSDWYKLTYRVSDHVNNLPVAPVKTNLNPTEYYYLVHSKTLK